MYELFGKIGVMKKLFIFILTVIFCNFNYANNEKENDLIYLYSSQIVEVSPREMVSEIKINNEDACRVHCSMQVEQDGIIIIVEESGGWLLTDCETAWNICHKKLLLKLLTYANP